ncbi:MAG: hypothetical protein ABS36_04565 [Acidobacteria bacterium SCN 69-37]|nr:MAG: hypothetical protein ABS36_04565 [Acidobacteria bacterium SCN 69-37]
MPYRVDIPHAPAHALDRLIDLGALDVDIIEGTAAAILPDTAPLADVLARLDLSVDDVRVSAARARDDGSIWTLGPRPVRVGRWQIVPAHARPGTDVLRLIDGPAFGTGLHATTALCLETLDDELSAWPPVRVLDVGTGSGILALAALRAGVPHATAIDIDADALQVTRENAVLNDVDARLHLVRGEPSSLDGQWPLVLANVLAAPLVAMAPALAACVARRGRLVLSGIRTSLAADVLQAYRHVGAHLVNERTRDGWTALTLRTPG